MAVVLMPDAETAIKQFLVDDPDISAIAGTNVATTLPADPPFPFIVIQLISTTPVGGIEANVNEFWVQLDCYAGRNDFATASSLARTIQAVFFELRNQEVTTVNSAEVSLIYTARIRNFRKVPEPETEWARYMLDALLTMRFSS